MDINPGQFHIILPILEQLDYKTLANCLLVGKKWFEIVKFYQICCARKLRRMAIFDAVLLYGRFTIIGSMIGELVGNPSMKTIAFLQHFQDYKNDKSWAYSYSPLCWAAGEACDC